MCDKYTSLASMERSEIRNGDLCFLSADNFIAKQIKIAQKQREIEHWELNHVGWFLWLGGELCVVEEDYPGRLQINRFEMEYGICKAKVYVGRIEDGELDAVQNRMLIQESLDESSEDRLFDYPFFDIIAFKVNALMYKWFKIDVWIGRKFNKKDKYSCSQRVANYIQEYHNRMVKKNHIRIYPGQLAGESFITLYNIV